MGRSIERIKIFFSDIDRLSALAQDGAMEIYARVLMPNHFHLLCKKKNQSLASSMLRILTGYVVNFNKRHRRCGRYFKTVIGPSFVRTPNRY